MGTETVIGDQGSEGIYTGEFIIGRPIAYTEFVIGGDDGWIEGNRD